MTRTLVIPDAHVAPDQDLYRFGVLGCCIESLRPDNIVVLGDFVSLDSLSHWDQDKPLIMENRRYHRDIEAGLDALELMTRPMKTLQEKQRRNKEKIYRPRMVWCHGNHENRLERYLEKIPELHGQLSIEADLELAHFGFTEIVPYKEFAEIEGSWFTHAVMNGAGAPAQGKYAVFRAGELCSKSVVFGHLHRKEMVNFRRHGSPLIQVVSAGAFFDETPDYSKGANSARWFGTLLLHHTGEGTFDIDEYSMERMEEVVYN